MFDITVSTATLYVVCAWALESATLRFRQRAWVGRHKRRKGEHANSEELHVGRAIC